MSKLNMSRNNFNDQSQMDNQFASPRDNINTFGGTAGLSNIPLNKEGVPVLPITPYLRHGNRPGIGTQIPNISGPTPKIGISEGPPRLQSNTMLSSRFSEPNKINFERVINNDTTFNYTDFNTVLLSESQDRLKHLGNQANRYLLHMANSQRFYNLPLGKIIDNMVLMIVAIFADLLELMKPEQINKRKYMNYQELIQEYFYIFIKDDRMIYLGVFLVLMSLLFMVLFLSS